MVPPRKTKKEIATPVPTIPGYLALTPADRATVDAAIAEARERLAVRKSGTRISRTSPPK